MPDPERSMTRPWNTWTRSLEPSTTRTWTLRVSPGAKSGMSLRRLVWSMRSVECMARRSGRRRWRRTRDATCPQNEHTKPRSVGVPGVAFLLGTAAAALDSVVEPVLGQQLTLRSGQSAAPGDQVGPVDQRTVQRLRLPPPGDAAVVAAAQHGGPGVVGLLEEAVGEGFFVRRRHVAHDTGHEAPDGHEDDHCRHLPAGQ